MNNNKELNELSEVFASINTNFQTLKAEMEDAKPAQDSPEMKIMRALDYMGSMINNVHNRIDNMRADMYAYQDKHAEGHLPKIIGADKMNKALAALGLDGDYAAQKKTVYASKDLFEIKLPGKKI